MSAIEVMQTLDSAAAELDRLSKEAEVVDAEFEPVAREYQDLIDAWEVGCWDQHISDGEKLPSEAMREKLARREVPKILLGRYGQLSAQRKKIERQISTLKTQVSAQQSLLSAYKLEAEASGAGLRSAA